MPRITSTMALSGDRSTVAGWARTAGPDTDVAFRWRGPGTYQPLGLLPNYRQSYAEGVSGNGSVVVGRAVNTVAGVTQAFRWTEAGGMQGLGFLPGSVYTEARGISRDGTTITGDSQDGAGFGTAFVWRAGTGITALPSLPGTQFGDRAAAVNFDGSVVVGLSGPGRSQATLWRNGQPIGLGFPPGYRDSTALAVDDSGSVVLCQMSMTTGGEVPSIWTLARGMEPLTDFFAANGISLPAGWSIVNCGAVSADGLSFGGTVRTGPTSAEGFIAVIPTPPASLLLGIGTLVAIRRNRRH
jgi:probable HAF family extracellular repeat protein